MSARARPPEWSVRCPWCLAPPGSRCTGMRGRRIPVESHDARITAFNQTNPNRTEEPT